MKMSHVGLTLLALLSPVSPARAQGGCGGDFASHLEHPNVTAIFKGTVTSVRNVPPSLTWPRDRRQIATMTVATVWKGDVSARTVVYAFLGTGNVPGMEADAEYLVFAHVLSPESRPWFGLPWTGEPALGSNQFGCGIRPISSPSTAKLVGDAPGRPPR
jgi:hypothetical protein